VGNSSSGMLTVCDFCARKLKCECSISWIAWFEFWM
jgi:hypothetical protein